jgi:hypothetical protein
MLEHNRNLSSIVGTIQDEGPPIGASEKSTAKTREVSNTASFVEAETFVPTWMGQQRSTRRSLLYLLFAALIIAATFILFMGGREGYQGESTGPADAGELVVPAIVKEQDGNPGSQEIYERQVLIMKRLEELNAMIADIKAGNDQRWVDNHDILKRMQEEFKNSTDTYSAAVAGLQDGPAAQDESSMRLAKGTSDINVVQLESELPERPEDKEAGSIQFAKDSSDVNIAKSKSNRVPSKGEWVVNVASSEHIEPVEKLMNKLHKRGIPVETQEVDVGGKVHYRLRVPGFSTSKEARDYARNLEGSLDLKGPWVSKR